MPLFVKGYIFYSDLNFNFLVLLYFATEHEYVQRCEKLGGELEKGWGGEKNIFLLKYLL